MQCTHKLLLFFFFVVIELRAKRMFLDRHECTPVCACTIHKYKQHYTWPSQVNRLTNHLYICFFFFPSLSNDFANIWISCFFFKLVSTRALNFIYISCLVFRVKNRVLAENTSGDTKFIGVWLRYTLYIIEMHAHCTMYFGDRKLSLMNLNKQKKWINAVFFSLLTSDACKSNVISSRCKHHFIISERINVHINFI